MTMGIFERFVPAKKAEQEKPMAPSFEELVSVLPEKEQLELRSLKDIERESATIENESTGEFIIESETLSTGQQEAIRRYWELMEKAKKLFEEGKK